MNGRAKRRFSLRGGRRSGFILITALVIILVGAALSVGVFALANSMLTTDVVNRKGYEEQTEVVRYIELAKGFIVTRNIELASRDEPVLHGRGGASNDYFVVRRLDDLQVCMPQAVGDVLSQDVPLSARGGNEGCGSRCLTLITGSATFGLPLLRRCLPRFLPSVGSVGGAVTETPTKMRGRARIQVESPYPAMSFPWTTIKTMGLT